MWSQGWTSKVRRTEYEDQIRDLELFIPKERKCRGYVDVFKTWENFYVKRGEGICVSQNSGTESTQVHRCFLGEKKDGQGLRSHLAQRVQIIFHLFATSRQLAVAIWNTVLRRILRLSLSFPGLERALTDSDVLWKKRAIATQVPGILLLIRSIGRFLTSGPRLPERPQSHCKR